MDTALEPKLTSTSFRRDPEEVTPWSETCGAIRCLIEESDLAAAEVHHVKIQDAKLHYHKKTDEIYYIIEGEGKLVLDDEEVAVKKGVVVYVPRGVKHIKEDILSIERKGSISEFARNITEKRFERELERMVDYKYRYVILEFNLRDIMDYPNGSGIPYNKRKYIKRVRR